MNEDKAYKSLEEEFKVAFIIAFIKFDWKRLSDIEEDLRLIYKHIELHKNDSKHLIDLLYAEILLRIKKIKMKHCCVQQNF
ncbi:MAG: hypothetical protein AABY15_02805 [Nanoarchaeota archaeon]